MKSIFSRGFFVSLSALLLVGAGCAQNTNLTASSSGGRVDMATATSTAKSTINVNTTNTPPAASPKKPATTSPAVKTKTQATVKVALPIAPVNTEATAKADATSGEQWCVIKGELMGGGSGSEFRANAAGQTEEKVNLSSDPFNCGQCAHVCWDELNLSAARYSNEWITANNSVAYECRTSKCVFNCREGFFDCDGNKNNGCEVKGACQ